MTGIGAITRTGIAIRTLAAELPRARNGTGRAPGPVSVTHGRARAVQDLTKVVREAARWVQARHRVLAAAVRAEISACDIAVLAVAVEVETKAHRLKAPLVAVRAQTKAPDIVVLAPLLVQR